MLRSEIPACSLVFVTETLITPTEIDTKLADLVGQWNRAVATVFSYQKALNRGAGVQTRSFGEALAEAEELRDRLEAEIVPLEAQYTGWSRFFLVTNTNGHIHSSRGCSTCYATTQYAWLPALSGKTEKDAVEEIGEILCSVCFPSAPVAWTIGVSKATLAERAERAAAKAEREAKKRAKALLPDPDASIKVGGYQRLATLAAAKTWLTAAYWWSRDLKHPSYTAADVERVAEAIAAKTGEDVEAIKAAAIKRADQKY